MVYDELSNIGNDLCDDDMKTPVTKILDEVNESLEYNSNVYAVNVLTRLKVLSEQMIIEEKAVIKSAFSSGFVKTESAEEYYNNTFDPNQLQLF